MRAFLTGGMILAGMGWRKLIIDDVKLLIEEAGSRLRLRGMRAFLTGGMILVGMVCFGILTRGQELIPRHEENLSVRNEAGMRLRRGWIG